MMTIQDNVASHSGRFQYFNWNDCNRREAPNSIRLPGHDSHNDNQDLNNTRRNYKSSINSGVPARRAFLMVPSFLLWCANTYNHHANGGDRLRQGFGRPTDAMPGYSMQLVKKRREKTIANNNELALAA